MMVVRLIIAEAVAVVLLVRGQRALGLFLVVGFVVVSGLNALFTVGKQQPGAPRRKSAMTGTVLVPGELRWPSAPERELVWSGGANVATDHGRMNATSPLAVMTLTQSALTLGFRPKLVGRVFGLTTSLWRPGEIVAVYPVRGRLLRFNRGLAIESTTLPLAYFWTKRPEAVLAALGEHDVPVDWAERQVTLLP